MQKKTESHVDVDVLQDALGCHGDAIFLVAVPFSRQHFQDSTICNISALL